jgi:hypothetical protein
MSARSAKPVGSCPETFVQALKEHKLRENELKRCPLAVLPMTTLRTGGVTMQTKIRVQLAAMTLALAVGLPGLTPVYAQTQGSERRQDRRDDRGDARDTRQDARQDSRSTKAECKKGDEKSRAECRQDKRNTKQDARENAREIKKD